MTWRAVCARQYSLEQQLLEERATVTTVSSERRTISVSLEARLAATEEELTAARGAAERANGEMDAAKRALGRARQILPATSSNAFGTLGNA